MAAPPLFRGGASLLRLRHHRISAVARSFTCTPLRRPLCSSATESTRSDSDESAKPCELLRVREPPKLFDRVDDSESEYRKWKDNEEEILNDIEPIVFLVKDILHSNRYMDGEHLTTEDEKVVVEKLLAYHPHSEDKIGCGLDSIIVDRHPQFRHSRCLFVVRTDGGWIDFSYQKCLREYIRNKYPSYAERFIREHLKRGSG